MKTIVKTVFGSHLYGTATQNSDHDFKGIFLSSKRDIYLGNISKSITSNTNKSNTKNTAQDTDCEFYSLHYFIKLACNGETVALDMLHTPKHLIIEQSPIWDLLVQNKSKFYTKNMKAFMGYARSQAHKYSMKGDRYTIIKQVYNFLNSANSEKRLSDVWSDLPKGHHINFYEASAHHNNLKVYEVCGRQLQESCSVEYAISVLEELVKKYGDRAIEASENGGVDFKAISHAFRVIYELKALVLHRTISFPLPEAKLLLDIKQGKYALRGDLDKRLDDLLEEVEDLIENSDLPEKGDVKFWNDFLFEVIDNYVK